MVPGGASSSRPSGDSGKVDGYALVLVTERDSLTDLREMLIQLQAHPNAAAGDQVYPL